MGSQSFFKVNVEDIYEGLRDMTDTFKHVCPICFRYFETTTKKPLGSIQADPKKAGNIQCAECDEKHPPLKEATYGL